MKLVKFALTPPVIAISVALCAALSAFAEDVTVNVGDSIEDAIIQAGESGTITLKAGTHYISKQAELLIENAVTIVGETGDPKDVIVTRPASDDTAKIGYRIFHLNNAGAKIKDLTAQGGRFFASTTLQSGCCVRVDNGTVEHCILEKSDTTGDAKKHTGGGFYLKAGRVTRSIIRDNKTYNSDNNCRGGGAYLDGDCQVDNCFFTGNSSKKGTIYINNKDAKVYNCTLVGNVSAEYPGFVMYAKGTVRNCISVDNKASSPIASYQLYDQYPECFAGCYTAKQLGEDNISGVLVFKDAANGDCRPVIASAVIDNAKAADVGWTASDLDLNGNPRVVNGIADIGCCEWSAATAGTEAAVMASQTVAVQAEMTLTAMVSGLDVASYSWNFGDGQSTTSTDPTVTHSYGKIGKYTVQLYVVPAGSAAYAAVPFTVMVQDSKVELDGSDLTVAEAVDLVADNGELVLKKEGSPYLITEQVLLERPVTVRGETGDPADVVVRQSSTKQVSAPIRVFQLNNAGAVVKDLTVTKGVNEGGSGIQVTPAGGLVQHCIITGNTSSGVDGISGVRLNGGRMTECVITNNTAGSSRAVCGVYMSGSAKMDRCLVGYSENGGNQQNGAVKLADSAEMDSCIVCCNVNTDTRSICSGVHVNGSVTIRNCTITGNVSPGSYTAGIYLNGNIPNARIVNCIVAGNSCTLGADNWKATTLTDAQIAKVFNNCFFSTEDEAVGAEPQYGNPDFTAPDKGDYTLKASSNARNNGTDAFGLADVDFAGNPRKQGDKVDIGALESNPSVLKAGFSVDLREGFGGTTFHFNENSSGVVGTPTFVWKISCGGRELTSDQKNPSFTLDTAGWYRVELKVICDAGTDTYGEDDYLHVAPRDVFVAKGATGAAYPYDTLETATPDFATAWREVIAGATLHVSGIVSMTKMLTLDKKVTVVGVDGRDTDGLSIKNDTVVTMNHAEAVLRGLRIQDGTRGIYMSAEGGLVEDCCVSNNVNRGSYVSGGGLYMIGDKAIVRRTIITKNDVGSGGGVNNTGGGGVYISRGTLENCLIVNNQSGADGDGVYVNSTKAIIRNCTIADNYQWNAVAQNKVGGGIFFKTGSLVDGAPQIVNCLLVNNRTNKGDVHNWFASATTDIGDNLAAAFTTCAMDQVNSEAGWQLPAAADVKIGDPLFKDDGSYRLSNKSPYIDAGTWQDWMEGATDLYGTRRCSPPGSVDIGCCETIVKGFGILVR